LSLIIIFLFIGFSFISVSDIWKFGFLFKQPKIMLKFGRKKKDKYIISFFSLMKYLLTFWVFFLDNFWIWMHESLAFWGFQKSLKQVISYTFCKLAHFLKTQKSFFVNISTSSSLILMNFFLNCRAKWRLQNKKSSSNLDYWMLKYLQKTIF
jgi:hypothetical protein